MALSKPSQLCWFLAIICCTAHLTFAKSIDAESTVTTGVDSSSPAAAVAANQSPSLPAAPSAGSLPAPPPGAAPPGGLPAASVQPTGPAAALPAGQPAPALPNVPLKNALQSAQQLPQTAVQQLQKPNLPSALNSPNAQQAQMQPQPPQFPPNLDAVRQMVMSAPSLLQQFASQLLPPTNAFGNMLGGGGGQAAKNDDSPLGFKLGRFRMNM